MTTPKAKFAGLALIAARCGRFILGLMAPAWTGFYKGVAAYNRGDYATAIRELRPLAERGLAEAQLKLGLMYYKGLGVPQDHAEAMKWYSKAAEQGNAKAQSYLGLMYYNGWGVPQDFAKAVKWFRKAAEQGDTGGQYNLGGMYYNGHGVPQDYVQAHMWYNLVASQDGKAAAKLRDMVAERMTPAQISEAQKLAREWRPKK